MWAESIGDDDLKNDLTKRMIERAQEETLKSKGTVPFQCSTWLEFYTRKNEINWKKALRGIIGNKYVGARRTIMRQNRRFPSREDLKGQLKNRIFNLLIIADVSGSMKTDALLKTLNEVKYICDITKTNLDLIQIDTDAYPPEKISKKTKLFNRKGCGGTCLFGAIEMAKQYHIDYQAIIILTDGEIFTSDLHNFKELNKKIIWLIESNGIINNEMNEGKMRAFKLQNT